MPAKKIQDETEVKRWFAEGKTYEWMCQEYERKYNLQVVPSTFGNFRRKHGIPLRIVRDEALIPWRLKPEHRYAYPAMMLRAEARRRAGKELDAETEGKLQAWLYRMHKDKLVVHYDPDSPEGFYYLAPRKRDVDLVRVPDTVTSRQSAE